MRAPEYSKDPAELFSAEAINAPHRLIARLRKELPIGEVVHLDS